MPGTLAGSETLARLENAYAQNLVDPLSSYRDTYASSASATEGRQKRQEETDSLLDIGRSSPKCGVNSSLVEIALC